MVEKFIWVRLEDVFKIIDEQPCVCADIDGEGYKGWLAKKELKQKLEEKKNEN